MIRAAAYGEPESDVDDDPIYGNVGSTHDSDNTLGLLPNVTRTDCNDYYCFAGEMDRAQCNAYMQDATDGEFLVRQNKVITLKLCLCFARSSFDCDPYLEQIVV